MIVLHSGFRHFVTFFLIRNKINCRVDKCFTVSEFNNATILAISYDVFYGFKTIINNRNTSISLSFDQSHSKTFK